MMMLNTLIENIVRSSKIDKIVVNGAVASVVQDMPEFKSSSNRGDMKTNNQYLLGNVGSTEIIVDPMIRYHDIRILTEDNSVILDLSLLGYTALDII